MKVSRSVSLVVCRSVSLAEVRFSCAELAGTGRVKGTKLPCIRGVLLQLAVYCLFGPTLTLGCDPGVWLSCDAVG